MALVKQRNLWRIEYVFDNTGLEKSESKINHLHLPLLNAEFYFECNVQCRLVTELNGNTHRI